MGCRNTGIINVCRIGAIAASFIKGLERFRFQGFLRYFRACIPAFDLPSQAFIYAEKLMFVNHHNRLIQSIAANADTMPRMLRTVMRSPKQTADISMERMSAEPCISG